MGSPTGHRLRIYQSALTARTGHADCPEHWVALARVHSAVNRTRRGNLCDSVCPVEVENAD